MKAIALVILTILAFLAACLPADAQDVNINCFNGVQTAGAWGPCADSGPITGTGAVNSSSHAAGTSVGGLITIPVGYAGIVTNFMWQSPGGSTGQLVIRIWAWKPTGTTCTDQTAFAANATDDKHLITPPFSVTPAAPAVTTGDAKTYASTTQVTWDYSNQDNPAAGPAGNGVAPSNNLYVCAVTVSTDTADESTSVVAMLSGPTNGR